MKILYVAKHGPNDNQDEDAISHALRELGHVVVCVQEKRRNRDRPLMDVVRNESRFDFMLFHKWDVVSEIAEVSQIIPSCFWYFDMVRPVDDDPTLSARSETRVQWMRDVLAIPRVVAGFCTDGDWVVEDRFRTGKLRWLMQGADERTLGFGTPIPDYAGAEILFTGMINHGRRRAEHVAHLQTRYGDRFAVMGDGGPKYRKHGRYLADVFASCKVVVAPDGPNTARYWSNRVYLTLGLGGYLLHPYCEGLTEHYTRDQLTTYKDWAHLDYLIDRAIHLPSDFRRMEAERGHERTKATNLYRHRCEVLVREMEKLIS